MSKDTIGVGIIGLGARGFYSIGTNLAHTCRETGPRTSAPCDRNSERMIEVRDVLAGMYEGQGVAIDPSLYQRGTDLIDDPAVDLIVITSITDTHRQYAVPALRSGKKVYCDKPLAQNAEDAVAIVEAEAEAENPLIMGLTRRYEAPWRRAFGLLTEGTVGDLTMILIRDIIPYHRYLQAWWRRREWSGGALSDNGSHLFDVFNWFTQSRAERAQGFGGRSVVEPDPLAPPRCTRCDRTCVYRRRGRDRVAPDASVHFGESWLHETEEKHLDDVCVYAPGSDVYHNGSIHFSYENGVIASYFYSIFGPAAEDQGTM